MRNNTFKGRKSYLYREGYKLNYYEDRLQPRYEGRYERDRSANLLKKIYINQA